MALQDYLDQQIQNICPIHGISFADLQDKKTWRIHFKNESTDEQKKQAQEILNNFEWTSDIQKKDSDDKKIEKYKDNLLMKQGYVEYLHTVPAATFLDYINYLENIKI